MSEQKGKGVPFVDVVTAQVELADELIEVFRDVLTSGVAIGGPKVEAFEKDFAQFCGAKYAVGVGNGTDALRFALMAAGVEEGDGVITVANTFVATVEAIVQAGAVPHFVDVEPRTYNLSVDALTDYLRSQCDRCERTGLPMHRETGRRIKAIIPVHLYGQMVDMDPIMALAEEFRLIVIEDSCQAHGAQYYSAKDGVWKTAGSIGHAAAFSFYPTKNLGACGEAGAVTTSDERIASGIRMIRDHGQAKKYHHAIEGYNGRLDAVQAGILQVKLRRLAQWNEKRQQAAKNYDELLRMVDGVVTPSVPAWARPVYHLYVIRSEKRDELQQYLTERKIATSLHYPIPLHLQTAYRYLGYREGDLPVSEKATREILSLPMFPELAREQQEVVVQAILQFCEERVLEPVAPTKRR